MKLKLFGDENLLRFADLMASPVWLIFMCPQNFRVGR